MDIIESIKYDTDFIFHYTQTATAIEHILYEKQLKFSKGTKTSDPREYGEWNISPDTFGSQYDDKQFNQEWDEAEDWLNKVIQWYKFACFCSNEAKQNIVISENFEKPIQLSGYERLRMWSQYGEQFFGICIVFSVSCLIKQAQKQLGDSIKYFSKRVNYENDLKLNDTHLLGVFAEEYLGKDKEKWAKIFVENNIDKIFFTKHTDYKSENEHRVVIYDPYNNFEFLDITGCIKAVLLGDRFKDVYIATMKKHFKSLNLNLNYLKKAEWDSGQLILTDV